MLIHIDASSFPNWNGTDQKRLVTITEDVSAIGDRRLKLTVPPAPTGGAAIEVLWRRAKWTPRSPPLRTDQVIE